MKTVNELIKAFSKGEDYFKISTKQFNWLISLAKKENAIICGNGGFTWIRNGKDHYLIVALKIPCAAYGGGIGSKGLSGRFSVTKKHLVQFDNGTKQYFEPYEFKNGTLDGYKYKIVEK